MGQLQHGLCAAAAWCSLSHVAAAQAQPAPQSCFLVQGRVLYIANVLKTMNPIVNDAQNMVTWTAPWSVDGKVCWPGDGSMRRLGCGVLRERHWPLHAWSYEALCSSMQHHFRQRTIAFGILCALNCSPATRTPLVACRQRQPLRWWASSSPRASTLSSRPICSGCKRPCHEICMATQLKMAWVGGFSGQMHEPVHGIGGAPWEGIR